MWSRLIEEYGNKTFTWTRRGSRAPRRRKRQKETSLGTIFFLDCCPITMSSLRNPKFKDSGGGEERKQQPGETKASWCLDVPRWHRNRCFRGEKKELPSCKFPAARWSKKHESARTSNILDSQVEERKLLHTNLIQTEKKSSWDNGGGVSPQDKNRQLQTSLDFVRLLSERRNLSESQRCFGWRDAGRIISKDSFNFMVPREIRLWSLLVFISLITRKLCV